MSNRAHQCAMVFFASIVLGACNADSEEITYQLTKCGRNASGGFYANFLSGDKRKHYVYSEHDSLTFGGDVKGEAKLANVKEIRLGPSLRVVFNETRHAAPIEFGALPPECKAMIRDAVSGHVQVVE